MGKSFANMQRSKFPSTNPEPVYVLNKEVREVVNSMNDLIDLVNKLPDNLSVNDVINDLVESHKPDMVSMKSDIEDLIRVISKRKLNVRDN